MFDCLKGIMKEKKSKWLYGVPTWYTVQPLEGQQGLIQYDERNTSLTMNGDVIRDSHEMDEWEG